MPILISVSFTSAMDCLGPFCTRTVIQNILIVDPILRGSRLVNTSHAIAGFRQRGWQAHLLTRREAVTEHYRELLAGSDASVTCGPLPVPSETWFEKLSPETIRSCMTEIERLTAQYPITTIFFTGWNEFFPALAVKIWRRTRTLNCLPALAIGVTRRFRGFTPAGK